MYGGVHICVGQKSNSGVVPQELLTLVGVLCFVFFEKGSLTALIAH